MKLQGVVFDVDGTLMNTLPVCVTAWRKTFLEYTGRLFDDDELQILHGPTEQGIVAGVVRDRPEEAVKTFFQEYETAHHACTAPFPGISEILHELNTRSVRIAVVTGKGRPTTEISLKRTGLAGLFEHVLTGSDDGAVKDVRLKELSGLWNTEPARIAYLGDTAYDVSAARAAGMIPLSAAWAPTADVKALGEAGPYRLFRTTAEMLEWVRSM